MADIIAATRAGDIQAIRSLFEQSPQVELEAQDEGGWTALMHAAKSGNVEIVQELLARGADPREAAAQDVANEFPHIAGMLAGAANGPAQPFPYGAAGSYPAYGPPQGMNQYGYGPPAGAEYYYGPQNVISSPPMGLPEQSDPPTEDVKAGDGSAANLPPPDVAKNIPCRYFPNCKYGAKCIFAHPGGASVGSPAGPGMPPIQRDFPGSDSRAPMSPMSPGMPPHSAGAPVYFQPPPGYGYAPMYGPPQPFYPPMGPPMPHMQYGVPIHYGPPPHMGPAAINSPDAQAMSPHGAAMPFSPQQAFDRPSPQQPSASAPHFIPDHQRKQSNAVMQPPHQAGHPSGVNGFPNGAQSDANGIPGSAGPEGFGQNGDNAVQAGDEGANGVVGLNGVGSSTVPAHRRQSFNSFLHRHTVQVPNGMGAIPPFPPRGAVPGKGRRGTGSFGGGLGPSGFPKSERLPHERPPCSFFASSQCKNGDGCRFPHILENGTDARNPEVVAAAQAAFNAARKAALPHATPEESVQVAAQAAAAAAAAASAQVAANAAANAAAPKVASPAPAATESANVNNTTPPATDDAETVAPAPAAASAEAPSVESAAKAPAAKQIESTTATKAPPTTQTAAPTGPAAQSKASNGIPARPAGAGNATSSLPGRPAGNQRNENNQQGGHRNGGGKGKKNGGTNHANQQQAAAVVPQQRLPSVDDFPALLSSGHPSSSNIAQAVSTAPSSHEQSAAGSATESVAAEAASAPVAPVPVAPAVPAPKANFSAVLSAPAPVKKAPSPVPAAANGAASEEGGKSAAPNGNSEKTSTGPAAEKSEKPVPNGNHHGPSQKSARQAQAPNGHAHKSAAAAAAQAAASAQKSEEDEDGFSIVKPRNAKRAAAQHAHNSSHAHHMSHSKAVAA